MGTLSKGPTGYEYCTAREELSSAIRVRAGLDRIATTSLRSPRTHQFQTVRPILCRRVLGATYGPPSYRTGGTRGTRRHPNVVGDDRVHFGTQSTLIQAYWVLFWYSEYPSQ